MENITVEIIEPKKTQTLMFENVAEVGDKIRAYDFLPRQDGIESFVEGEIINKGYLQSYYCYFIKVTKRRRFRGSSIFEPSNTFYYFNLGCDSKCRSYNLFKTNII